MAEMINFNKVTSLLLQHGEWYSCRTGQERVLQESTVREDRPSSVHVIDQPVSR